MAESEFAQLKEYLDAASSKPITAVGLLFHDNELYALYVDLAVRQCDVEALHHYAPLAMETATRDGHRLHQANAHRAWGVLHRLKGEYWAAENRLQQALALFQGQDTRWQIGRTLYELAEVFLGWEDSVQARDYYAQALSAFSESGAVPDVVRTQTAIESLRDMVP